MDLPIDIEKDIAAKIEETTSERRLTREKIDGLQSKLDIVITKIGGKPKDTDEGLVKKIKDLEFWHSTTTQDNASERKFMLDMDKLKKKRVALAEYTKLQETIDEMKLQKNELMQRLKELEKKVDDLHQAARKVKTASKLGCDLKAVVERVVVANDDQVPTSMFRQLSEQFGVDVSGTRIGGSRAVRVQGIEAAVEATFVRIEELLKNVALEISVSNSSIYCLLMCNAAMLNRIEKDHSVRIDLSRSALTCKIGGAPENVANAIAEINSIQSSSIEVKYENSALPFIIGKAGSGLRSIEEDNCVHLEVVRDRNVIVITGFVDDVDAAAELVKEAADGNRSVEEILKIPRHIFLGCLQRDGGALLKSVRTENPSVVIQTLKALERQKENAPVAVPATSGPERRQPVIPPSQAALDAAIGVDITGDMSTDSFEYLLFKGPAMRAIPARNSIQAALNEYMSDVATIKTTAESVGFVVGKKGVRIEAIRKQFPTSTIDVSHEVVYVHSASAEERVAVLKEIQGVIDENLADTLETTEEAVKSLVGAKGADTRAHLEKTLSLNVNIDIDSRTVKLRGNRNAITDGIEILKAFETSHWIEEVPISDEDCSALTSGGAEALSKDFETQFNVEIYVSRKQNILKIRGHKDSVAAASAAITRMLAGEAGSESQLIPYDKTDLRFLIGKGGETIAKLESDNEVRIDILKSSEFMRVRGKSPERVTAAVAAILIFLGDVMDVQRIPVRALGPNFSADSLRKHIAATKEMFAVKVLAAPSVYSGRNSTSGNRRKPASKAEKVDAPAADAVAKESAEYIEGPEDKLIENVVVLQGKRRILKPAVIFLESLISGIENYSFRLSDNQFSIAAPLLSSQSRKVGLEKYGATFTIDPARKLVTLENCSQSAMIKSKGMLFRFLDEFLPAQFASLVLPAACISHFNDNNIDKIVADLSGASIQYDYHFLCVRVSCYRSDVSIKTAIDMLEVHKAEWSDRFVVLDLEDKNVIPYLVGKSGAFISEIEKAASVTVRIDSKSAQVTILGETKEACKAGEEKVRARIAQYAKEHWSVDLIDLDALGSLIGKGGSKINQLRTETGANIDVNLEAGTIRVSGEEDAVKKARETIQTELARFLDNNSVVNLKIPMAAYPLIVGKKGATIQDLQKSTKVRRIDLNRDSEEVVIRGSAESCAAAESKIRAILDEAGFSKEPIAVVVPLEPTKVAIVGDPEPSVEKTHNGSYMKSNGNCVLVSKSHLKRLRKKGGAQSQGKSHTEGNDVDDENEQQDQPQPKEEQQEVVRESVSTSLAASSPTVSAVSKAEVVTKATVNTPANDAALNAMLTDLAVTSLSVDTAPPVTPPALAAESKDSLVRFTPFFGPSVVPSPVYDSASPNVKPLGPPPGIVLPVRSMRSARVGIIGSVGASKAPDPDVVSDYIVNSHVNGIVPQHISSVSTIAPVAMVPPASSADSLLNLLLDDSLISRNQTHQGNPVRITDSKGAPPVQTGAVTTASNDGYYKSKGGFSVRLS